MSTPNLTHVKTAMRASLKGVNPAKTGKVDDMAQFYKTTIEMVQKAYKKAGMVPTEEQLVVDTWKIVWDVLEMTPMSTDELVATLRKTETNKTFTYGA